MKRKVTGFEEKKAKKNQRLFTELDKKILQVETAIFEKECELSRLKLEHMRLKSEMEKLEGDIVKHLRELDVK